MSDRAFHHELMATTRRSIAKQVLDAARLKTAVHSNRSALSVFRVYASSRIGSCLSELRPEVLKILAEPVLRGDIISLTGLGYIREELPSILPAALVRQVQEEFGEVAGEFFISRAMFGTRWTTQIARSEVEELGKLGLVRWVSGFGEVDASWIRLLVTHTGSTGSRLVDVRRLTELSALAWDRLGGSLHASN
jgi:hypothetical protein